QFLQVVGVPVDVDERDVGAGERVADLEVALAAGDLPDVSPWLYRVVAPGVVHPLADLVGGDRGVLDSGAEQPRQVEVGRRVGLRRVAEVGVVEGAVVAEDAAVTWRGVEPD